MFQVSCMLWLATTTRTPRVSIEMFVHVHLRKAMPSGACRSQYNAMVFPKVTRLRVLVIKDTARSSCRENHGVRRYRQRPPTP